MARTAAGIDVGTTKIATVVGELGHGGHLRILGVGVSPSQGLKRGMVVDIDEAVQSIGASVDKCQKISGIKIDTANISIANPNISSQNSTGVVAVANNGHDIGQDDINRVLEAARMVAVGANADVLHVIPRGFKVDNLDGVKNPIGMTGSRLEVETHIVSGGGGTVQNLVKCVERAGVVPLDLVLEPLASADAVLTDAERMAGVMLVDIGGGTTDLAIFLEGSAWRTAVMPVGGSHITNDVAIGLRAPYDAAEELKIKHGRANGEGVLADEPVRVATEAGMQQYLRAELCEIIEARVEEIMYMILDELHASGYKGLLPAGVVLTGGTAQLAGIADVAARVLQMPVRVGSPTDLEGLVDTIGSPAFATCVGLVRWAFDRGVPGEQPLQDRQGQGPTELYGRLRGWLRAFLP
ncbi:MAG TPA: cell division protein FtsA [Chloroflexota bacterium]|nr:cell division protein FtsA [Chloroflexota bacterium]